MKKTISHSALVLVRNCLRQYRNSYIELRRTKAVSPALVFGGLWDKALTAWHWGKTPTERLFRGNAILAQHPNELQRETAKSMLLGYSAMWGNSSVETVATQLDFTAPIINPVSGEEHPEYRFTGVIDGVVRLSNGRRLLGLESKTSSEDIAPGSTYWQRITTLDPQVSMYLLGAKEAGYELEAILYDVAKKPLLRPSKTETAKAYGERVMRDIQARPDFYFQRQEVVRLESEERAYQQDLWDYACILSEAERLQRFPRNPDRCRQFGRDCEFIGVCTGVASLDDDYFFETKKRGNSGTTRQDPARPAA